MTAENDPEPGQTVPDHRQYMRYVEQHAADSLDDAVADVEAWADAVMAARADRDAIDYPCAAWFARQLRADLAGARRGIAEDNARIAAWYALRVGELIVDARRHGHLDDARFDPPDDPIPN